ncbi:MAG: tetratricopeptide repeat protein [Calditrichaeota bacterium]|nr:tetratricopeptide repeat protein [Calditrichota bacterium]
MAKVLHLHVQAPSKFGFKRVRKRKKKDPESHGQMNLFSAAPSSTARIVNLPSPVAPFELALSLDEKGEVKAAEAYQKAIAAGDCLADAYCNLGILQSKAGRTDEAFDSFTKSLKHAPRHLESHYNLANLYFEIGDLRLAREHYEIAVKIEPRFSNIYFNLGLVLAMSEHYRPAVAAFSKYKELVSKNEACKADELLASLERTLRLST